MYNSRKKAKLTPIRYVVQSIRFRKIGFLQMTLALSGLMAYIIILGGILKGGEGEISFLLAQGKAPPGAVEDFINSLKGWFAVISLLYVFLIGFLCIGYFTLVGEVRRSEIHLLKALGLRRGQVDFMFIFEGFVLSLISSLLAVGIGFASLCMISYFWGSSIFLSGLHFKTLLPVSISTALFFISMFSSVIGSYIGAEVSQHIFKRW